MNIENEFQINTSKLWNAVYENFENGKPLGISYPTEALIIYVSNLRKSRDLNGYFDDSGNEYSIKNSYSGKALEIGFGSLANIKMLREKGFEIDGIEVSEEAVVRGRQEIESRGLSDITLISWIAGDRLPYEDGRFDLIVGLQCIYYNLAFKLFLDEIYRVLAPGKPFIFNFFSEKHGYMNYVEDLDEDYSRFSSSHPNARLRGGCIRKAQE